MMRISLGSLRTRLILIVLLVIIPAFGLSLYSWREQRHHALSHAQENALTIAKNASDVQERLIENTHQILFTLSQMPEVRQLNAKACTNVLNNLQIQSKVYSVFFAAKPNGDVFASALPLSRPTNFADRPWFRQIIQTREFVIGEYQIGRITGKATLALAYPVLDSKGKLKAIVATGLDLGWLNQFMTESKIPAGTTLTVIDRMGTILLRYPEPEKFTGKTLPEGPILKAILAKGEGVSEAISLDGIPRLYGFTSLDRFAGSVYVSVGIPKEIAFAAAMRDMRRNLIWLGIIGALAIITTWFGSSFLIVRPVDRLLGATKRLAEGDLAVRTGPRYDRGEIGELAFAFDQMANALAEKEAQIREYTGELERHVAQRTEQLSAANAELEAFSYSVSHDLRAPLRAISGFTQIIARRHRANLNEEGQHYVDNIIQGSERMGKLIDDLLMYSRIGRSEIQIRPVPLGDVLTPITLDLSERLKEIGAELNIADDLPTVCGDPTMLMEIFHNLLGNALKYRRPNVPLRVTVDAKSEDDQVVIRVADNGIGIPDEYRQKIFDVFQRLHSEDEYPGTGIGLSIVKKSVTMLGGNAWVESVVGKGSVFYVRLKKGETV